MAEKEIDLKKYNEAERAFLLGKTNVDPATGKPLTESQADFEKTKIAFEKEEAKRAEKYAKRREAFERTKKGKEQKADAPQTEQQTPIAEKEALPAKEVLEQMEVKDLIALGVKRGADIKANVDNKPTMIEKLLKTA